MCKDKDICEAVCRACNHFKSANGKPLPIIGAANTFMESVCEEFGIPFIQEYIVDLEYDEDGNIIITREHDAVDLGALSPRVAQILRYGTIQAKDTSSLVDVNFSDAQLSLCVHSDTPGAVEIAAITRKEVDAFNNQVVGKLAKE